jgi:hypothetical protein
MAGLRLLPWAVSGGLALLNACARAGSTNADLTNPPGDPATVTVNLSASSIAVGGTTTAVATMFDQNGDPIPGGIVLWSTTVPAVATIGGYGAVTGVTVGQTKVVATVGATQGQATLTVTPPTGASVNIVPSSFSMLLGRAQQLAVIVRDAGGTVLLGQSISYASDDVSVATVSPSGLVTATGLGNAVITATNGSASGTASVTVTNVAVTSVGITPPSATITSGQVVQLTATPLDAKSNPVAGRQVNWTTNNAAVATVTAQGNLATVTGGAGGTAQISATSDGVPGSVTITVLSSASASVVPGVHRPTAPGTTRSGKHSQ